MNPNQNSNYSAPGNINWGAIHKVYYDYKGRLGNAAPSVPQPQAVHPAHAMMVHAMSLANQKPGEDHGSMIIRALSDHLKRVTPDVSAVHKQPAPQEHHGA